MEAVLRVPEEMRPTLADVGEGLVFVPNDVGDDWAEVRSELLEAFRLTQEAFTSGTPICYVVLHDDLLGRRGPGPAMVATGLLSAARTAAIEGRKPGVAVNVLAVNADTEPETLGRWVARLLEDDGLTGELIRLGSSHLGKALP